MRILVLGGTRFIGRAIVEELVEGGHDVTVVHRGQTEPEGWVDVDHIHCERQALADHAGEIAGARPDVVVDTLCMSAAGAEAALGVIPDAARAVVLSSIDVYQAYGDLITGKTTQPVPVTEESPVRAQRYPYKGGGGFMDVYEKLDVEEPYLARGGTVCRLPMVYGPFDGQRREEFMLRRVRAGRKQIPFGSGTWLSSRAHARDIATGVSAIVDAGITGEVFNVCETTTLSTRQWAEMILDVAGHDAEFVTVPDDALPPDMEEAGAVGQHLLASNAKLRAATGWRDGEHRPLVADSVRWHLANPPAESDPDFSSDDGALARARG